MRRKLSAVGSSLGNVAAVGFAAAEHRLSRGRSVRGLERVVEEGEGAEGGGEGSEEERGGGDEGGAGGALGAEQERLALLTSLCRIDDTPRLPAMDNVLSPQQPYLSLAGDSLSPTAITAALFQMHLQGSSRRGSLGGMDMDASSSGVGGGSVEPGGEEGTLRRKSLRGSGRFGPDGGEGGSVLRESVRFVRPVSPLQEVEASPLSR